MKKALFSMILMGLNAILYVSAAEQSPCKPLSLREQLKRQPTPKEIFDHYGKKAQTDYQKLEKSENPSDQQKKAFIDQNRNDWKRRKEDWKKNEPKVNEEKQQRKEWNDRIVNLEKTIKQNKDEIDRLDKLNSCSPFVWWKRFQLNKHLEKSQSELPKIINDTIALHYGQERKIFKDTDLILEAQKNENKRTFSTQKSEPTALQERLLGEISNMEQDFIAFARCTGLRKTNLQLLQEYRAQQLKE